MPDYVTNIQRKKKHAEVVLEIRRLECTAAACAEAMEINQRNGELAVQEGRHGQAQEHRSRWIEHRDKLNEARRALDALHQEAAELERRTLTEAWL
jgi:hypothetical protein